jgi:hypothetical protein
MPKIDGKVNLKNEDVFEILLVVFESMFFEK